MGNLSPFPSPVVVRASNVKSFTMIGVGGDKEIRLSWRGGALFFKNQVPGVKGLLFPPGKRQFFLLKKLPLTPGGLLGSIFLPPPPDLESLSPGGVIAYPVCGVHKGRATPPGVDPELK